MGLSEQADSIETDASLDRYARQVLFAPIGREGQARLAGSQVTLIGCGALGTVIACTLVRAGVGRLRLADRDYIELNNLQRQTLFDETDLEAGLPKAAAAAEKLRRINSAVQVEPHVTDVNSANIERLLDGSTLVLDGTDNFETRFLINDAAVKHALPWIYGACVGATGMMMPIVPGQTPCLRCVWESPPPPGVNPTCDTAGVIGPVVHMVAGLQCVEALKLLTGRAEAMNRRLVHFDAWLNSLDQFSMGDGPMAGCRCCGARRFDYLDAPGGAGAALCGRNAVQVQPMAGGRVSFEEIAARLGAVAAEPPRWNRYLLRFRADRYEITLFGDGRAIIKGTSDPAEARGVYSRFIGT